MLKKQAGFNLIELMIAATFGMIVTAGAVTIFWVTSNSNRDVLNAIKLNQELRGAMSFMVRDLRRAGSWNYTQAKLNDSDTLIKNNPFNQAANFSGTDVGGNICVPTTNDCTFTCIEFAYDLSGNGTPDGNSELFGFGFEDNALKTRQNGTTCVDGMAGWEKITDDTVVNITNFGIIDLFPDEYSNTQIRLLEIRLTGALVNDSSVTRELVEYVRIRNDYIDL